MAILNTGVPGVLFLVCLAYSQIEVPSPIVTTSYGDVQGWRRLDRYARTYDAFLGIPFAQPPVDELRWAKPIPPDSWEGVRETTQFSSHCLQFINGFYGIAGMSTNHSEDCLYLNVYVPKGVDAQPEARPVMVFYYGGGFIFGTQEMYPPYHLANYGDVIVVNFDYRVSSIGFLTTGDSVAPGNFGLWDGQAVLTWIQQNIAAFGGDPNRVTIFGQSAGGAMVSATTLSPSTAGLFQGAIAMSGGVTGFLGTRESYGYMMPQFLGDIFGCNSTDNQVIVDCLKFVDGEDIVFWGNVGSVPERNITILLRPTLDYDFLAEDPLLSYENGVNSDIHFITGNCRHDAAGTVVGNFFGLPINRTDGIGGSAETIEMTLESLWNKIAGAQNKDELVDLIVNEYPLLVDEDRQTRTEVLSEADTDWQYGAPSHLEADYHSAAGGSGSTYRYVFSHDQTFLFYPDWINGSHTDDMYSMFGEPYLEIARILFFFFGDFEEVDLQVSDNIMTYFTNFAHTFNPNEGPRPVPDEWPEYNSIGRQVEIISPNPYTETLDDPEKLGQYDFWNNEFYDAAIPAMTMEEAKKIRFLFTDKEMEVILERMKMNLFLSMNTWYDEQWEYVSDYMDEFLERRKRIVEMNRLRTQ